MMAVLVRSGIAGSASIGWSVRTAFLKNSSSDHGRRNSHCHCLSVSPPSSLVLSCSMTLMILAPCVNSVQPMVVGSGRLQIRAAHCDATSWFVSVTHSGGCLSGMASGRRCRLDCSRRWRALPLPRCCAWIFVFFWPVVRSLPRLFLSRWILRLGYITPLDIRTRLRLRISIGVDPTLCPMIGVPIFCGCMSFLETPVR